MRRLLLTLAFVAFSLPAAAQEPPRWAHKFFTGKDEAPPPVILHDFGTLPKGTIKTYRFKMTNIYAVPMQVKVPDPSCRCLSVIEYTGMMNPRETGHIDVEIDTRQVEGPKSIVLNVKFEGRDPKTKESFWSYAKLEVRAVSRPDIAINPGAIEFGVVAAGQKASQSVSIFYSGRQRGWNITEVAYKKELLDVAVVPVAARGGVAFQLTATLKANAPAGAVDEQIILKTNDPGAPALSLNVTGTVQAPLSLVPGDLMKMGPVEVGKKLEKNVIVRADKEFKVKSVEGQGDGVSVALLPLPAKKSQVVTVTFMPDKPGPVKKVLTIKTDTGESVALTVEGIGTEPR
jgi:hypothetical protein